jgi:AcrR family transcriptional regulator
MSKAMDKENVSDDTRKRIIDAALRLFGQVGYIKASTRAIAEAAGVNEVTLFRHFGSKKNLLMACMQAFNETSFPEVFESNLTGDFAADTMCMALQQIEDTRANLDILRVMLCDTRTVPELREAVMAGARGNLSRLIRYFQRQIDAGVVRQGLSAETLAFSFDSLFSTSLLFENLFQEALTPQLSGEDAVRQMVDIFVRGTQAEERKS